MKLLKNIISKISLLLLLLEIIIIIIFLFFKIFYKVYVIASPSMEPRLKVGNVIISKKYNYDINELREGMIITYHGKKNSYKGKLITHEIISIDYDNEIVHTKGINNELIDPIVNSADIESIFIYVSPTFTFLYKLINNRISRIFIIIIIIILIIINIRKLFKSLENKKYEETN